MMDELAFLPATAAADLVRRKVISARELAELVLARIDALNPALNAVVEVRRRRHGAAEEDWHG